MIIPCSNREMAQNFLFIAQIIQVKSRPKKILLQTSSKSE